jgi:hypothetical protein
MPFLFPDSPTQINTPSTSSLDRRGLAQVLGQGLISAEDTDNVDGLCTTRIKRKLEGGFRGLVNSFKKLKFHDKEAAAGYLTQRMTRLFSSELQKALTEEQELLPNVIDLTLDDESVDPDQEAIPPTPPTPQPPVIEVYDSDEEEEMQEEESNEDADTVVLPISTTMQTCSSAESKASSTVSELQRNWDHAMEDESQSSSSDDEEYEPTEVPTLLDEDIDVWPCQCGAKTWKREGVEYCSVSGVPFQDCTDEGNGTCICGRNSKHGTCLSSNKAVPTCDLPKVE